LDRIWVGGPSDARFGIGGAALVVRVAIIVTSDEGDDDWKAAELALEAARRLPGGAARIEALKQAGRLRFDADRKRQNKEIRQHGPLSHLTKPTG